MAGIALRLYVSGDAASSRHARDSLNRLRQRHLPAGMAVAVIDVADHPLEAEAARILATPTLVIDHPVRPRRIVGDLGDLRRVLELLGLDGGLDGDLP